MAPASAGVHRRAQLGLLALLVVTCVAVTVVHLQAEVDPVFLSEGDWLGQDEDKVHAVEESEVHPEPEKRSTWGAKDRVLSPSAIYRMDTKLRNPTVGFRDEIRTLTAGEVPDVQELVDKMFGPDDGILDLGRPKPEPKAASKAASVIKAVAQAVAPPKANPLKHPLAGKA
mmetsp:Transcript_6859/g.15804  ORF Transcript_6859/g.15804 Transcript_6859/m.15804 type:complete len:171 (-) Transcript_6859:23-535(-)|eukprot:CAMPEP_0114561048 /NCGR_PEP_ID=MMETSP0114-20121206/11794_1 /TAXON_ID=31324 /ORGANISM="Goniomonas sp, Strain m" /LENGTH=170 /DNA_ID=CAMNT_0001746653 /DNA_START=21 /DNA_END=533 /DNA_ORIENTATION=-